MKIWTALFGFAVLCLATGAGAQTLLSNPSLIGSVSAGVSAIDYRYTKHTRGGSGRGGGYHTTIYYTWDPHTDELKSTSLAMVLNASSGVATATGAFYSPKYDGSASGTTSLSSGTNSAVFTTTYNANFTVNSPQVAHQRVTAAASASSKFYFTLTDHTDVTITTTGSAGGGLALFGNLDEGVGVIVALNGPGTVGCSLPPGNYWISSSTGGSAVQDTQLNSFNNLGTTDASFSFTAAFSRNTGGD